MCYSKYFASFYINFVTLHASVAAETILTVAIMVIDFLFVYRCGTGSDMVRDRHHHGYARKYEQTGGDGHKGNKTAARHSKDRF